MIYALYREICRENLRTFSADFFHTEKQNPQTLFFFGCMKKMRIWWRLAPLIVETIRCVYADDLMSDDLSLVNMMLE